jgi:hypothetical protein
VKAAPETVPDVIDAPVVGPNAESQEEQPSRYIPVDVQRPVWERDGGRCQAILPDGTRCRSTYQLELDHCLPFALGGTARRVFGDALMDKHALGTRNE